MREIKGRYVFCDFPILHWNATKSVDIWPQLRNEAKGNAEFSCIYSMLTECWIRIRHGRKMIGSEEMEKRPENCVQRMDLVGSNGAQSKALRERTNERTNPNDSPYSFANSYLFLFKSASLLHALSEMTHFICVDFCQPGPSHMFQDIAPAAQRAYKSESMLLWRENERTAAAAAGRGRRGNYAKRSCKDANREL